MFLYFLINTFIVKSSKESNVDTVFYFDGGRTDFIPNSLKNNILQYKNIKKGIFDKYNFKIVLLLILKRPFSIYFNLKILVKICNYAYIFKVYDIKYLIASCEYSFTSSILTHYCEFLDVEHVNIMHGEKAYGIRDSFCRFSKFYVWDAYYIKLFKSLKHATEEYIIELPPNLKFSTKKIDNDNYVDYTYYLQAQDKDVLIEINKTIEVLIKNGYKVRVRPHPTYSKMHVVKQIFSGNLIEDYSMFSLQESIMSTRNTVSVSSTVLFQAYNNGVNVVIDDISDPNYYKQIIDEDYIMLSKKHDLLSKILYKRALK